VVEGIILVGLALSPLAVFHGLNWVAVLLGEGIALVLVRLDLWSVYDRARHAAVTAPAGAVRLPVGVVAAHRRLPRAAPAEPGASPSAPAVPGASSAPRQRSDLHRLAARGAGRGVGIARRGARSAGSTVKPAVDSGARRLGKVIGGVSKRRDPGCPPDTSGG
jgi:hypothetical protein